MRKNTVAALSASALVAISTMAASPAAYASSPDRVVRGGQTWVVSHTTRLHSLTILSGAVIEAPTGKSLTLTVNGVETGQKIEPTDGTDTVVQPGRYRGDIVLTVTDQHLITQSVGPWTNVYPLRQALYVDASGVVQSKSVLAAVRGGRVTASGATSLRLASTGEAFNGVYVAGGSYVLNRPSISFDGNGRCDFVGYGAGIVSDGSGTRLVVDRATINNTGAVRTGIVAANGSNLIVEDSSIATHDGTLPADYQPTILPIHMMSAPWMLGIVGNVRATNVVGTNTTATYLRSSIYSTGWGVLSTDGAANGRLTAIDSAVRTGSEGYGAYADGQTVTDRFLGSSFQVADYGVISTGGDVIFADSTRSAVKQLNTALDLRLSTAALNAIPVRATTVNSGRFGVMWHSGGQGDINGGTVTIGGHTQLVTGQTAVS